MTRCMPVLLGWCFLFSYSVYYKCSVSWYLWFYFLIKKVVYTHFRTQFREVEMKFIIFRQWLFLDKKKKKSEWETLPFKKNFIYILHLFSENGLPTQCHHSTGFLLFIWFDICSTKDVPGRTLSFLTWAFVFELTYFIDYWSSRKIFWKVNILNFFHWVLFSFYKPH